jgi:ADP-ribosylglycohydrolase
MTSRGRALAALQGLAIGDALGMPLQMISRETITARYGTVTGFLPADADHPPAGGMPAGSITDDTEQALLLAHLLIAGDGHVDPAAFAAALVAWENDMRARGSSDLMGLSTKRAVDAILAGEPVAQAGRYGTTNGAAMRITPVRIAVPSAPLERLVERVVEVSSVSHNTGVALAGPRPLPRP